MAQLIKADGTVTEVTPKEGKLFTLEELQGFVDGYIEIVPFFDGRLLVLDEEGKLKDKLVNPKATVLAHLHSGIARNDLIVGDVLICNETEID